MFGHRCGLETRRRLGLHRQRGARVRVGRIWIRIRAPVVDGPAVPGDLPNCRFACQPILGGFVEISRLVKRVVDAEMRMQQHHTDRHHDARDSEYERAGFVKHG